MASSDENGYQLPDELQQLFGVSNRDPEFYGVPDRDAGPQVRTLPPPATWKRFNAAGAAFFAHGAVFDRYKVRLVPDLLDDGNPPAPAGYSQVGYVYNFHSAIPSDLLKQASSESKLFEIKVDEIKSSNRNHLLAEAEVERAQEFWTNNKDNDPRVVPTMTEMSEFFGARSDEQMSGEVLLLKTGDSEDTEDSKSFKAQAGAERCVFFKPLLMVRVELKIAGGVGAAGTSATTGAGITDEKLVPQAVTCYMHPRTWRGSINTSMGHLNHEEADWLQQVSELPTVISALTTKDGGENGSSC
jgi:hypothetical protein